MGKHDVVIVIPGLIGTTSASQTVTNMVRTFRKIRFGLLVGVGGGAPAPPSHDPRKDIHLGDVVVSFPRDGHGEFRLTVRIVVKILCSTLQS